jgi:hypothetical protein
MKTIEVSDELHEKLIALANEMTTQDPRCTRGPHLFQIRTIEKCAAYEGQGETIWIDPDGEGGAVDPVEFTNDHKEILEGVELVEFEELDLDEQMEELGCYTVQETTLEKFQNCFFTAKACQDHIDRNHYHYNEPIVYLNHGWRNPEMELVQEFLCGLVLK